MLSSLSFHSILFRISIRSEYFMGKIVVFTLLKRRKSSFATKHVKSAVISLTSLRELSYNSMEINLKLIDKRILYDIFPRPTKLFHRKTQTQQKPNKFLIENFQRNFAPTDKRKELSSPYGKEMNENEIDGKLLG